MTEYIRLAGIEGGPLFRPRRNSRSEALANRSMDEVTMWRVILGYLERIPGCTREVTLPDGSARRECIYTPHSLRATTATLLLDAGVDIRKVQELLGHRHVTITQIYESGAVRPPKARPTMCQSDTDVANPVGTLTVVT
jgi:integrase